MLNTILFRHVLNTLGFEQNGRNFFLGLCIHRGNIWFGKQGKIQQVISVGNCLLFHLLNILCPHRVQLSVPNRACKKRGKISLLKLKNIHLHRHLQLGGQDEPPHTAAGYRSRVKYTAPGHFNRRVSDDLSAIWSMAWKILYFSCCRKVVTMQREKCSTFF